jgi:hypothetical protein
MEEWLDRKRKEDRTGNVRKKTTTVHVIANCETCNWGNQDYQNGRVLAARHAKTHKHLVRVEVGRLYTYDNRFDKKP